MPPGRPRAFVSPESLQTKAEGYFSHCDEVGKVPLVSGLCNYLKIHTDTLNEYGNNPDFSATVKNIKLRIQEALEYMTFDGAAKTGAIFNLKCNFKFRDSDPTITIQGNPDAPIRIEQIAVSPIKPMLINPDDQADALDQLEDD